MQPLINKSEPSQHKLTKSIEVHFNGACPVCLLGLEYQKNRMQSCPLIWHDISLSQPLLKNERVVSKTKHDVSHIDIKSLRKKIHVTTQSGEIMVGMDAVIAIWQASPKDHWKAKITSFPAIRLFAHLTYNAMAFVLYQFNKIMGNHK
ncbi:MAG: DUF393 domain-containing protein [Saccharospirillaceae bacterium]|nr:DUF393 domain-containing protein [Pseudomonadales bacterium]NRB79107.1 DUF393 domain-containing protein [Saccharospirillaceae bacterium]